MVNTIWFRVDLIRLGKDLSVFILKAYQHLTNTSSWLTKSGEVRQRTPIDVFGCPLASARIKQSLFSWLLYTLYTIEKCTDYKWLLPAIDDPAHNRFWQRIVKTIRFTSNRWPCSQPFLTTDSKNHKINNRWPCSQPFLSTNNKNHKITIKLIHM